MRCKDCAYMRIYVCDKHGEIPVEKIDHENKCKDYEKLGDAVEILKGWLSHATEGTIEHQYIGAILKVMHLQACDESVFDSAVTWIYGLRDSKALRAIKASVQVFHNWSPI